MRQRPLSLPLVVLLSAAALGPLLAGCGGSSEEEGGGDPPPGDDTPPFTTATPGGGLFNALQSVTLESDEVATIYYSLDGSDPSPTSVTTLSGASPIFGIPATHPLTLKFYGVDEEGNTEAIQTEVYDFDLDPPVVLLSGTPQTTLGWLESSTVTFVSNEAGSWSAELGGTGQPGTGTVFATGTVQKDVLANLELEGWRLDLGEMVRMDLYVFDAALGWGRLTLDFQSVPSTSFPLPGLSGELAITPDGRFLYVLRPVEGEVWKYDVAPPTPTHAELARVAVGTNPSSLAITPDSGYVYVTCGGKIVEIKIDPADATLDLPLPNATTPSGIEITPDGHFAYFVCDDGYLRWMNVDSTSPQFHQVVAIANEHEPSRTEGQLAIAPAGDLAVVHWTGAANYGVKILDTDEGSVNFQQIIDTPITSAARPATLAPPSISPDGSRAYLSSLLGKLSRMDISAPPYQIQITNSAVSSTPSLPSPDGSILLLFGGGLEGFRIAEPFSLNIVKTVSSGSATSAGTGDSFVYSPDGTRGYLVRDQGDFIFGEMWVIRLKQ